MPDSPRLARISWSLGDQAVVSAGAFLLHVLLARGLPGAEYGVFALMVGSLLNLQVVNAALLFHPVSVRLAVARAGERDRLVRASLALLGLSSLGLAVLLAVALAVLGRADLVLPGVACFLLWQAQEGLRRCLLSCFRHRAAALGDSVSYLGQCAVVLALDLAGAVTVESALYSMAATSAAAAAVQWLQLRPRAGSRLRLRATAADYWSIGGGWSLGSALLLHARSQLLLFGLAAGAGTAAAAAFQAASNVVNMANPVMLGLCNLLPQAASQASAQGPASAWRAARGYMLLAVPPIFAYAAVLMVAPGEVSSLLYGDASPYAGLALEVRLLVAAACLGYAADAVVSFLHGIAAVRTAFRITAVGAVATAVLAVPLIGALGVLGLCLTHIGANAVRLAAARHELARLTGRRTGPAPAATAA